MSSDACALCPSGRCREGAALIGVLGPDGSVGPVTPALAVSAAFVAAAQTAAASPESRFRFAEPCAEAACGHWTEERCGLIDAVLDASTSAPELPLPRCAIRRDCRWFDQRGPAACRRCTALVRTSPVRRGISA
jgi:hypothetical protein